MPEVTPVALVNLRRHLYHHLLNSLRLVQVGADPTLQIHELIDFAHIVYARGLYMQALQLLERAKELAMRHHQDVQHLGILEFEKRIQSRYITRATSAQMAELTSNSQQRSQIAARLTKLTNLKLRLQRYFILHGHAKDDTARDFVREALGNALDPGYMRGTFFERVYGCEAAFWQGYICIDFEQSTLAARQWLSCYAEYPDMIEEDPDMYLRGLHHLLHSSWFANNLSAECAAPMQIIVDFTLRSDKQTDTRTLQLAEWYRNLWQTNIHLFHGRFDAVVEDTPQMLHYLDEVSGMYMDSHKRHLLLYKLAAAHLAVGKPGEAVLLLNQIIHKGDYLREDIDIYTRLLMLMAHYELGNFDLLGSMTDAVGRLVAKIQDPPVMETALLRFFRAATRPNTRQADNCLQLVNALELHRNNPAERRGFIYLDGYAWAKRKLPRD